ncbi:MAG: type II secretion system F family protein [Bacteroidota bacterium]
MNIADLAQKPQKVELKEPKTSLLERDIQLFPHSISLREKETMYRQLQVLQEAGVDIKSSFEILLKQLRKKQTREKLQAVLEEVINGSSLSEALSRFKDFSPYEIYSLRIGEETGQLTLVMNKLAAYFENQSNQKRLIINAISYPLLIVFTSFGAISFMIFVIIPMFEEVFLRFGSELPGLTQTIVNFSHAARENAFLLFFLLAGLIVGFVVIRRRARVRLFLEWIGLKIPLIGTIYKYVYLSRFCDAMSLLIQSNVPMLQAMDMVKKMIGFLHIERIMDQMKSDLVKGNTITGVFEKHSIFEKQMIALIQVGEEVNRLGLFFDKLSKDYADSVKHKTALMATFLEPFMIIFLGLVVGIILVAMYLPMFELSSSMNFGT